MCSRKDSGFQTFRPNVRNLALVVTAEECEDVENVNLDDFRVFKRSEPVENEDNVLHNECEIDVPPTDDKNTMMES